MRDMVATAVMVGSEGIEPSCRALGTDLQSACGPYTLASHEWWSELDLNQRPSAYQADALTQLSYRSTLLKGYLFGTGRSLVALSTILEPSSAPLGAAVSLFCWVHIFDCQRAVDDKLSISPFFQMLCRLSYPPVSGRSRT